MLLEVDIFSPSQDKDNWSWEAISNDFSKKVNSKPKPKYEPENPIVRNYLISKCLGCTETPCLQYHSNQNPRREIYKTDNSSWNYRPSKCQKPGCKNIKCKFSHTREELLYHPLYYQTVPCKYALVDGVCSNYKTLCPYSHNSSENLCLENENDQEKNSEKYDFKDFKTVKCMKNFNHNNKSCPFYHKFDRRRDLKKITYSAEYCTKYNCEDGDKCSKCHNQIEYWYHPNNFKKNPCKLDVCSKTETCPFYHYDKGDRIYNEYEEFKEIYDKCAEINNFLQKKQEKNQALEKFMCCYCCDGTRKAKIILRCGHGKCLECELTSICVICHQPTQPTVQVLFTRPDERL
jgi:hypothetical protein